MKRNIRWIYVLLGLIIFICLGTVYSWSIFRKPLESSMNLTSTESSLPFMTFLAFYSFLMPLGGKLITKFSPRMVLLFGGILVGLGWILASLSNNISLLVLSYGVVAGSGVGICYGVPISVVSKWFPDKQGLALGILLSGFGMSPFITAPLAKKLIDLYNPFTTFKILGIIFLVFITLLSLPFKFPNEIIETKNADDNSLSTKDMLKNPIFYILWTCFAVATFIGLTIIGITGPVAEEIIGVESGVAVFLVSLFSIFNGLGRPLFGYLSDKLKPAVVIRLSLLLILSASLLMLMFTTGSLVLYIISFSILWMNFGGWLSIAPSLTSKFFGRKNYSQNYGIVFTAYGFGAISGNLVSGTIKDSFGSYKFVAFPILLLTIFAILISEIYLNKKIQRGHY